MGGTSEKKTGWLGGEYTEHKDEHGNVIGTSTEETGWLGGKYAEHRDAKGNVVGTSTDETGWLGGEYREHRDRDGNVSGTSTDETGWLGGEYTEHRDADGNVTGTSTHEAGWLGGHYVAHHDAPGYDRGSSSDTSGGGDPGGYSSGYLSSSTSDSRPATAAGLLLLVALIYGGYRLVLALKNFAEEATRSSNQSQSYAAQSTHLGGQGDHVSPPLPSTLCGAAAATPAHRLHGEWSAYSCMDEGPAGPQLWAACLPRKAYAPTSDGGCPGTQRCCPLPSALPTTACGDATAPPSVDLLGAWTDYTCRDGTADEGGCLTRKQYTEDKTRGCPGSQRCCPSIVAAADTADAADKVAEKATGAATTDESGTATGATATEPTDATDATATPSTAAPTTAIPPSATATRAHQASASSIESTCADTVERTSEGFRLGSGWCFYRVVASSRFPPFRTVTFAAKLEGEGYGAWVGQWNQGKVAGLGVQFEPGLGGVRHLAYPETERGVRPTSMRTLDSGWHEWRFETAPTGTSVWLDGAELAHDIDTATTDFGFRTWRGKIVVRDVTVAWD